MPRVNDGRHPATYRRLPKDIPANKLREITVATKEEFQTALLRHGLAFLPPEVLRSFAGDELDAAVNEAHAWWQTTGKDWKVLFHDASKPGEGILVGDRTKKMSPNVKPESAIAKLFLKLASFYMPGYEIALNDDGSLHLVLLYDEGQDPSRFPGCNHCQTSHSDMICHDSGHFSLNPTLEACTGDDGPRILWLNFELLRAISLCFFLGSHHLARAANLYYEHYALLWMEFQDAHQGSKKVTETDFYPIWAKFLHDHLEKEVMQSDRGGFIEKEAVAVSVQALGAVCVDGLTVHTGINHPGLRGFTVVVKKEHQRSVKMPNSQIEPWSTSRTYAGIMGGHLAPLQVCVSFQEVAKNAPFRGLSMRHAANHMKTTMVSLLRSVDEETGLNPSPLGDGDEPHFIRFGDSDQEKDKLAPQLFGLVCQDLEGRKAVLWVENRTGKDPGRDQQSCNFKGAAHTNEMCMRLRRGDQHRLRPVADLLHPETKVVMQTAIRLVYNVIKLGGVPLPEWQKFVLTSWHESRVIPEELRWGTSGVMRACEGLANIGWRFGYFDAATMCIDQYYEVKLTYAGGGFLGEPTRPRCNQGQRTGPQPMMRRAESFVENGILVRNLRQMNQEDRDRLLAAEIGEPEPSGGDASSAHVAYGLADARQWMARQRGKAMGIMACWDVHPAERLYDDELAAKLETAGELGPIPMDLLRQTDFQQVILWFAFGFRPARETFSEKKTHLKRMLEENVSSAEDLFQAVERFLHGLKPGQDSKRQDQAGWCRQPAAMRRVCEMLIIALDSESYEKVSVEFSYTLFLTITIFNPGQELLLQGDGIAMMVKVNPFGDPVFERKALKMLKLTANKAQRFNRRVLLRNEGEYGVGVFAPGKWKKGEFFCWYLGIAVAMPHGRHVLTSFGSKKEKYCDGSNSYKLPLPLYIELGAPGPSVNSSKNRPEVRPNLKMDRKLQILHEYQGIPMVVSPLFVAKDCADTFTWWEYDPDAAHGKTN